MRKLLYGLYWPIQWLWVVPIWTVSTLLVGVMTVVFAFIFGAHTASYWGVVWSRLNCLVVPIVVKVKGRENIDKKQSYVIIANHQSAVDVFILYGWLGIDFKWVMKKELRKVWGLGIACEKIGHIFIDRSSPKAAFKSVEQAKVNLVGGTSVVVFPEGSRSGKREMAIFKRGAGKMAVDLDLPILPVTINHSYKVFTKEGFIRPGICSMIIHPPISPISYKNDISGLMNDTRNIVDSGLSRPDVIEV